MTVKNNKNFFLVLVFALIFFSTVSKAANPWEERRIKEANHINDYYFSDQTTKNIFQKNQKVDDLSGCLILVDMGRWKYVESKVRSRKGKMIWERPQSWMFPDGMVSEKDAGINDKDYVFPQDSKAIYVGPWKPIELKYGYFWNRQEVKNDIRYIAFQGIEKNQIYSGFEFKNEENELIPEQSLEFLAGSYPSFDRICEVKWIAKYGYNAILDTKTGKIIQAKE